MHKKVAQDAITAPFNHKSELRTLEIGAGTLNHLPFEQTINGYDIVEPFHDLYKNSPLLNQINTIYKDINEINHNTPYDRIISIATFEHICDLPDLVQKLSWLMSPQGILQVAVPSEGTLLWKLGWMVTTGIELKIRTGLNYSVLNQYEHVNTAAEIETILHCFFKNIHCSVLGVCKALSFYQYFKCTDPVFPSTPSVDPL